MSRPGTATTASTCLRVLRFFRRGAEGHRQLVTAWVENRILTAPLYPDGRCAPFALRYSLPLRHVNHLIRTSIPRIWREQGALDDVFTIAQPSGAVPCTSPVYS